MSKLLAEIDTLAPKCHVPNFEELSNFKYLEQVVNESSRLYPVAMVLFALMVLRIIDVFPPRLCVLHWKIRKLAGSIFPKVFVSSIVCV
jgi:cytochrome P450